MERIDTTGAPIAIIQSRTMSSCPTEKGKVNNVIDDHNTAIGTKDMVEEVIS